MNPFCHFERSEAKRNAVEKSLIILCSKLEKITVRDLDPFDFAQGKTFARHDRKLASRRGVTL